MKDCKVENIRTIGLLGHGGTGKTSIAEAILFDSKEIDRIGKVDEGTTVCDFDAEERKRHISIGTTVAHGEWRDHRIYLVDTPGYFDFVGELVEGVRAVDAAVISVCAVSGVQVGTEKSWKYAKKVNIPRAFFINKLDRENSNYDRTLSALEDKFGLAVAPVQMPIGAESGFKGVINIITKTAKVYDEKTKSMIPGEIPAELMSKVDEYRNKLMEEVAETDEELLDKFLSEGELSPDEILIGLKHAVLACDIAPVFCGSATMNIGIQTLLDAIIDYMPSPVDRGAHEGKNPKNQETIQRKPEITEPFSAFVFKTVVDPFVGRLSIFRVLSGTLASDINVYNGTQDKVEKFGSIYLLNGKNQTSVPKLQAGDIGAVAKLQYTVTGDTLCDQSKPIVYEGIKFPEPCLSLTIKPKTNGDEDKMATGLHKLLEEDPTIRISRDVENAEMIVSGLGEIHIEVVASKLKSKFGAEVLLETPKVPYRETIKKAADVQGKYKKQSGGHGQYGDVHIKFEPQYETQDLVFVDQIVGGVVPRQYIPAVEKGLRDAMKKGVLAGYPVINLKASLHYGSYHPVDSSEMAFKTAASMAYKKGLKEATPILLEPIMFVQVTVPDEYMGDVMGDINKRRGKVQGMEQVDETQVITAEVPMAEMFKYATDLRSMTQARGSFTMKFEKYEEIPAVTAQKIIENAQKHMEEEEE